ncbi:MAG TPA: UDP-N-acetylmuramoyl-tripeptide--D-alanyl-D-alanine ligase [Terriglobales bacterium]|nr:UDP-N-acetylmuramoyl-tripeptide--D-alanyl-D-alanine ligase [Terriglobales bacterium]
MKLSLEKVAEWLGGTGEFDGSAVAQGYSIDTRSIQTGELFFAVKGERLDGHDFVASALERGATAAVVQKDHAGMFASKAKLIFVDDTLLALQKLATCVRRQWGKPLVAVTGSAGKTTTKELIAKVLGSRYRVHKTEGNLNNHFGLPLQLLKLEPEHEIAVIELGMSHPGEITALAKIAEPGYGVVTNVAPVHLGFFRSIAGIAKAKQELIDSLPSSGTAVLNADDEYVSQFGMNFQGKIVMYGVNRPADVRADNVEQRGPSGSLFDVVAYGARHKVALPLIGQHNIYNALAAIAVGLQHDVSVAESADALATIRPVEKRGQVTEIAGATVVNDCYNSNPRALDSMVDALAGMVPGPGGRRIVVAGEMLELGPAGEDLHRRSGAHMAESRVDAVVGVRGLGRMIVAGAKQASRRIHAEFVETPEQAGEWLAREARKGDIVLVKGSRGVKLEKAIETWQQRVTMAAAQE